MYHAGMAVTNEQGLSVADHEDRAPAVPGVRDARLPLLVLLVLASLAGAGVLAVSIRAGPGVTPDSVSYLAAAVSLRDGAELRGPDGEPFVAFPPLLPALLSPAAEGRAGAVDAARVVNAASYGLIVFLTGWLVLRLTGSGVYAVLAATAAALSRPVVDSALHVWSESLFTALCMATLMALAKGWRRQSRTWYVVAGALAGLAAIARYVGLTLAPVVVAAVVFDRRRRQGGPALAVLVAAEATVPLLLWMARNLAVSGTLTGERYPSADALSTVLFDTSLVLARWAVPAVTGDRVRVGLALLGAALLLAGVWQAAWHPRSADWRRPAALIAGFCLLYLGYLVAAATLTALDPIDDRLISPVVPPLVVLAFVALAAVGGHAARRRGALAAAVLVVAAVWPALLGYQSLELLRRIDAHGIGGYEAARWRGSPLLAELRRAPPDGTLYSNDPFAVWYWTGREARLSPRRHPYRSPGVSVDDLAGLRAGLTTGGPAHLVWFEGVPRDFLLSLDELQANLDLEPTLRAPVGAVYRIE
jgi:hypothetical protein